MSYKVRYTEAGAGQLLRLIDEELTVKVASTDTGGDFEVFELTCPQGSGAPRSRHPWAEAYYALAGTFDVAVGARRTELHPGDTLLILESMKMEIPVLAEVGGTVAEIKVTEGDVVQEGDVLVVLA